MSEKTKSFQSIKEELGSILQIEVSEDWAIFDAIPEKELYLVSYKPGANVVKYGNLRGIAIDRQARTIVCSSFGYTPTITLNEFPTEESTKVEIPSAGG